MPSKKKINAQPKPDKLMSINKDLTKPKKKKKKKGKKKNPKAQKIVRLSKMPQPGVNPVLSHFSNTQFCR